MLASVCFFYTKTFNKELTMKYFWLFFAIILLSLSTGCKKDENPVAPSSNTIEDRITAARPYTVINVITGSTFIYENGGTTNPQFTDAYTIDGFFVFETSSGTQYCNLSTAKEITIQKNSVRGGSLIALRYQ